MTLQMYLAEPYKSNLTSDWLSHIAKSQHLFKSKEVEHMLNSLKKPYQNPQKLQI